MRGEYTASCAVCGGSGEPECPHEGQRLQMCIEQAEKKWIESWIGKHREWATMHAINSVTTLFNKKKDARKQMYRNHVANIPYWPMYQNHRGNPPLHPHIVADIQRQLAQAENNLRLGIDYDWKQCVVRYPEVLTHFYNQIKVTMPTHVEQPFPTTLAGGGAPRPPSIVNMHPTARAPPPPPNVGAGIHRSATAPPKKQRRSSKVNGGLGDEMMEMLQNRLEQVGFGGAKEARARPPRTPVPPSHSPALNARSKSKRLSSRDYDDYDLGLGAPPRAPPPPPASTYGGLRNSAYENY